MTFLNPLLLFAALGIGLPILAHLLNRYQVKRTDWAAMQFLNRSVRVRSRQLKLRDIVLLLLRCLALLFIVFALSRPATKKSDSLLGRLGEVRAGVIIAVDASFSMQHGEAGSTRFDDAMKKVGAITEELRKGDPVTLVLCGAEHRVLLRNVSFDPEKFDDLLREQKPLAEALDIDSLPRQLKKLAEEMKAPQKEIYIITDIQDQDWKPRSAWLNAAMKDLAKAASVFIVPVESRRDENLAITGLELVSGVLRKDTSARYRATARNCGSSVAQNVRVSGQINNVTADTKVIPAIAPGTSETVSLFFSFRDPGPVRITALLDDDLLPADNARRAVAVIRDRVSVLCVEGSSGSGEGNSGLISAALQARGNGKEQDDLEVQPVPWVDLPGQDLGKFDVVILSDVPDITPEQAQLFEKYVRAGNGLIWFAGDYVKADIWNMRSSLEGTPLLPAVIDRAVGTSDAMGIGRPLDPSMPDHPACRPLLSLPEDLLSEARVLKLLRVKPAPTSTKVLTLAGNDEPVLLEHTLGRGHVFMFTTSAGPAWNNIAVTPVFPMLLQQMVTYLTSREFETQRQVGETLSLSYEEQPDASEAVFDTPSGETVSVPVREYQDQYVALLGNAGEAGFYTARVSLQAEGIPVAVNVDTRESTVKSIPLDELRRSLEGTGVTVARSSEALLAGIADSRQARSLWRVLLMAGLAILVAEALFADLLHRRQAGRQEAA